MLTLPHGLRFLLATDSDALTRVLGVVYRTISRHLIGKAGLTRAASDLRALVEQIAGHIGRALERRGPVERDLECAWLATDTQAGPLDDLLGHSITYRIAVGPRAGQ